MAVSVANGALSVVEFVLDLMGTIADALGDRAMAWSRSSRDIDARLAIAIGTVALAVYLFPTVGAGLVKSDVYRAYLPAYGHALHLSTAATFEAARRDLAQSSGGFFPLASIPLVLWLAAAPIEVLRGLQLAAIELNAATFALLVARVSRSGGLALLTLGWTGLAIQLRIQHDPLLEPLFAQQLLAELAFVALFGAVSYITSSNSRWLILAFGGALAAALTDESGYAVCVLVAILVLMRGFSPRRTTLAFALCCIPFLSIGYAFRAGTPPHAVVRIVDAFAHPPRAASIVAGNAFAALPTSYRAAGNLVGESVKASSADTRFLKIAGIGSLGWLAVVLFAAIVFWGSVRSPRQPDKGLARLLIALSAGLWLLPAFLPIGERWNGGMPLGASYDGVYLETFGVGLLAALALCAAMRRSHEPSARVVLATAAGLLALLVGYGNVRTNAFVLSRVRETDARRVALERAARGQLFNWIPAGSTIVLRGVAGFDAGTGTIRDGKFALYALTGKEYITARGAAIAPGGSFCATSDTRRCASNRNDVYVVSVEQGRPHAIEYVTALHWSGSSETGFLTDRGFRFTRYRSASARTVVLAKNPDSVGSAMHVDDRIAADTTIDSMHRLCGPVDAAVAFEPVVPSITWGDGFYPPYPSLAFVAAASLPPRLPGNNPWGFARRVAHLIVHNVDCHRPRLQFSAQVYTADPAIVDVRYLGIVRSYAVSQDGVQIDLVFSASVSQIDVTFETNARRAEDQYLSARFGDASERDMRMLVNKPIARAVAPS